MVSIYRLSEQFTIETDATDADAPIVNAMVAFHATDKFTLAGVTTTAPVGTRNL